MSTCPSCGQPSHRYGPDDPNHKPTYVACVNALLAENERLREILTAVLGPGLNADEFRARYFAGAGEARCRQAISGIGGATLVCSRADGHDGHHSDGVASWTRVSA